MKYLYLALSLLLSAHVFAQQKLPVIKATSRNVAINDGGYLDKNAWSLSPEARPDIFIADRTREPKWVTFYTDIDSIRVKVKPGTKFNFVILLNGKDSCYTQIASALPAKNKLQNNTATHDTIPFILTSNDAIAIKAIINNTDTLTMHFDISSPNFHLTKEAILKKTGLLPNRADVLAGKATPNYGKMNRVTKLQLGKMVWTNPPVSTTNLTATEMDGRIGWNVFEGKLVEIDYDRNIMIIHSQLPLSAKTYTRSKMEFIRSLPCVKGVFEVDGKPYPGNFAMDTGSPAAFVLDSAWAARANFSTGLKLIRSSILHDASGTKYETKIVLAPQFSINHLQQKNIPAMIFATKNPAGVEINFLGNDLLKRYNMILDLKNDYLYLKPNHLTNVKYLENS